MNIREFIKKLQNLPPRQKKVILWAIVTVLGVILAIFWWNSTKEGLRKINPGETIKQFMPSIEGQNSPDGKDLLQLPNLEEQKNNITE